MGVEHVLRSAADPAELARRSELAALLGVSPRWTVGQLSAGTPSPGADVGGVSPVAVQMWQG